MDVDDGEIIYSDTKRKSNLWVFGLYFYSISIPMLAVSNFLYFLSFKDVFRLFGKEAR